MLRDGKKFNLGGRFSFFLDLEFFRHPAALSNSARGLYFPGIPGGSTRRCHRQCQKHDGHGTKHDTKQPIHFFSSIDSHLNVLSCTNTLSFSIFLTVMPPTVSPSCTIRSSTMAILRLPFKTTNVSIRFLFTSSLSCFGITSPL